MIPFEKNTTNEHETKYMFNNNSAYQVIQWLNSSCVKDIQYPSGIVSSIYYDTKDWKYISEKINSDFLKTKIRIRWYSDLKNQKLFDYSFAEAKFKIGSSRKKVRVKIPYSGKFLNTISLENSLLLDIPKALMTKDVYFKKQLFPAFQISYKRLRFLDTYSGARICLDYDISAPRVNGYMVPRMNPFKLSSAIFEVKGKVKELPASLKPLLLLGFKKTSFSKYQACYEKIMQFAY